MPQVTTLNNVAKTAASNIGTLLVKIWDVSNKALKHHNYSGLWRLTLLTRSVACTTALVGKAECYIILHAHGLG